MADEPKPFTKAEVAEAEIAVRRGEVVFLRGMDMGKSSDMAVYGVYEGGKYRQATAIKPDISMNITYGHKALDHRHHLVMMHCADPVVDDGELRLSVGEMALLAAGFAVNPLTFILAFGASYAVSRARG
jgi:hypothetical protein